MDFAGFHGIGWHLHEPDEHCIGVALALALALALTLAWVDCVWGLHFSEARDWVPGELPVTVRKRWWAADLKANCSGNSIQAGRPTLTWCAFKPSQQRTTFRDPTSVHMRWWMNQSRSITESNTGTFDERRGTNTTNTQTKWIVGPRLHLFAPGACIGFCGAIDCWFELYFASTENKFRSTCSLNIRCASI